VLALCDDFNRCALDMDAFVGELLAVAGRDALVRSCDIDAPPPVRADALHTIAEPVLASCATASAHLCGA
jgi:hypothetical protein